MDVDLASLSAGLPTVPLESTSELKSTMGAMSPMSPQQVSHRLEDLSSEMDRCTEQLASMAGQFADERSQHRLDVSDICGRLASVESNVSDMPRRLRDDLHFQQQVIFERLADLERRVSAAAEGGSDGGAGSGNVADSLEERKIVKMAITEACAAVQCESEWWHKEVLRLDAETSRSAQRLDLLEAAHLNKEINGASSGPSNDATIKRLSEWMMSLDEHLNMLCKAVAESKVDLVNTGKTLSRDVTEMREDSNRVQQTLQVVQAQMDAIVSKCDMEERRVIDLSERIASTQEAQTDLRKQMEDLWQGLEVECQERREKAKAMATKMEVGLQRLLQKLGSSSDRGDRDDVLPVCADADTTFGACPRQAAVSVRCEASVAPLSTGDSEKGVSSTFPPMGTPVVLPAATPVTVSAQVSDPMLGSRGPLQLQAACAGSTSLPPNGNLLGSPCSSPPVAWPRQLGQAIGNAAPQTPQPAQMHPAQSVSSSPPAGGASTQAVYRSTSPARAASGPTGALFAGGPPIVTGANAADRGIRASMEGQPSCTTPMVSYRTSSPTRELRAEPPVPTATSAAVYRAVSPTRQTMGPAAQPAPLVGTTLPSASSSTAADGPVPLRSPPMAYRAVSPTRGTLGPHNSPPAVTRYRELSPGRKLVPSPQVAPLNMPQPFPLRVQVPAVLTPTGIVPPSAIAGHSSAASPPVPSPSGASRRCPSPQERLEAMAMVVETAGFVERSPVAAATSGACMQRPPVPVPLVSDTTPPSTIAEGLSARDGPLHERDQYMSEIRKLRDTTERLRAEIGARDHLLQHVQHKAAGSVEMPPPMQRAPVLFGGANLTVGQPVDVMRSSLPSGLAAAI